MRRITFIFILVHESRTSEIETRATKVEARDESVVETKLVDNSLEPMNPIEYKNDASTTCCKKKTNEEKRANDELSVYFHRRESVTFRRLYRTEYHSHRSAPRELVRKERNKNIAPPSRRSTSSKGQTCPVQARLHFDRAQRIRRLSEKQTDAARSKAANCQPPRSITKRSIETWSRYHVSLPLEHHFNALVS